MDESSGSMPEEKPGVLVLLGPTGSGKTGLVCSLDPERVEVVSCDSRQVYREMEIGTAAPTREEREAMPHHCVDFVSPDRKVNAALYRQCALPAIRDIIARGKTPLVVGGTGFYYTALKTRLFHSPPDPGLRERLARYTQEERLLQLRSIDPDALQPDGESRIPGKIHPNDDYRITRALEVSLSTGEPWSLHWERSRQESLERAEFAFVGWHMEVDRSSYREHLRERCRAMVERGFVEEAGRIYEKYGDCPGLGTLGYDRALEVYRGERSREELVETLTQLHYQYGKKQMTWFRREEELELFFLEAGRTDLLRDAINNLL